MPGALPSESSLRCRSWHSFRRSGTLVAEAEGREDVRELIYQGYRIIYLTRPEQVFIVTIVHGGRDLATKEVKPWDGL